MDDNGSESDQGVGTRIRAARQERRMTQEALAASIGVSRSAVAQWETGRAGQLRGNVARLASELGVGVEWLLVGERKHAAPVAVGGDELAMLRLYRECSPEDRQILLRTARRLSRPD